jgi:site-specific DNA recombinase
MRITSTVTSTAENVPATGQGGSALFGRRRGSRAYIYVRVSTAREEMISPELQETSARRWCTANGVTVVDVIHDLDLSGRDFAKRKIAWMTEQIQGDAADGVVVWQVSRWGRSLEASLNHIRLLQEVGGWLASATESLDDMETPFGRFTLTQLLSMAQLQSDQIRAAWLSVHERRRRLGLPTNTAPRIGYVWDETAVPFASVNGTPVELNPRGVHVQVPAEAHWLRHAYEQRVAHVPMSAIVAELQDAGVTTRGDRPITYNTLTNALDSGFGAGLIIATIDPVTGVKFVGGNRYYEGAHRPVIDRDMWAVYVERRSSTMARRHRNPVSPLSGIVRCTECGSLLSRNRVRGVFVFECPANPIISRKPCPDRPSMREALILAELDGWLAEHQRGDLRAHYRRDDRYRAAAAATVDDLERKVKQQRATETETARLMVAGKVPEDIGAALIGEARTERERLQLRAAELRTAQGRVKPPPTPDQLAAARRCVTDSRVPAADAAAALRHVIREVRVSPIPPGVHWRKAGRRVEVVPAWVGDGSAAASPSSGEAASML